MGVKTLFINAIIRIVKELSVIIEARGPKKVVK